MLIIQPLKNIFLNTLNFEISSQFMLRITFLVNLIWRWDDLRIKEDGQLHQA